MEKQITDAESCEQLTSERPHTLGQHVVTIEVDLQKSDSNPQNAVHLRAAKPQEHPAALSAIASPRSHPRPAASSRHPPRWYWVLQAGPRSRERLPWKDSVQCAAFLRASFSSPQLP